MNPRSWLSWLRGLMTCWHRKGGNPKSVQTGQPSEVDVVTRLYLKWHSLVPSEEAKWIEERLRNGDPARIAAMGGHWVFDHIKDIEQLEARCLGRPPEKLLGGLSEESCEVMRTALEIRRTGRNSVPINAYEYLRILNEISSQEAREQEEIAAKQAAERERERRIAVERAQSAATTSQAMADLLMGGRHKLLEAQQRAFRAALACGGIQRAETHEQLHEISEQIQNIQANMPTDGGAGFGGFG